MRSVWKVEWFFGSLSRPSATYAGLQGRCNVYEKHVQPARIFKCNRLPPVFAKRRCFFKTRPAHARGSCQGRRLSDFHRDHGSLKKTRYDMSHVNKSACAKKGFAEFDHVRRRPAYFSFVERTSGCDEVFSHESPRDKWSGQHHDGRKYSPILLANVTQDAKKLHAFFFFGLWIKNFNFFFIFLVCGFVTVRFNKWNRKIKLTKVLFRFRFLLVSLLKRKNPRLISWVMGSCCVGSLAAPLNLYYKLISCNSNLVVKRIVCTLFHS